MKKIKKFWLEIAMILAIAIDIHLGNFESSDLWGFALIKMGAFVTDISGKIGGTIFSRGRGGAYAKNKVIPLNPQTQAQQLVRQGFGALSAVWRGLLEIQRKAWDAATDDYPYQNRLGETKFLSGFGLHQQINLSLGTINKPRILIPLAPALVNAIASMVVVITAGGVKTINATKLGVSADTDWSVEATESVSPGVSNVSNRFKRIAVLTDADTGAAFDIDAAYTAVFGEPLVGSRVTIRLKPVNKNTGQSGVFSTQSTIVV